MINRRNASLAAMALAIAAAGIVAALAQATLPGKNGQIAFSRYRFVNSPLRREIWVANLDGSGLRQLTHVPPNIADSSPDWAPDGSRLVFTRCSPEDAGDRCTIWTVRSDGTGQRMLSRDCGWTTTATCLSDDGAVYSPDGRRLVFQGSKSFGIVVSDAELRNQHVIFTPVRTPDIGAFAWSPDGKRIAFEAENDGDLKIEPIGGRAIYVVNADGGGLRRITPWNLHARGGDKIDWSPDGARILFHSVTSDFHGAVPRDGDLYTIRPDGTGLRRVTHLPAGTGVQLGSYSPDGKWIVFATADGATAGGGPWPDVFVIRADGSGLTPVTRTRNWEGSPDWGPRR